MDDSLAAGQAALASRRWQQARIWFQEALRRTGSPEALAGLGDSLFFLGEVHEAIQFRERAYASFRRAGNVEGAVDSAVWLCLTYGMAAGNEYAARGWLARAESLLPAEDGGTAEAWVAYCRAVLSEDSAHAHALLSDALACARRLEDADLELCSLAETGVALAKLGDVEEALTAVDEAMAGTLGGEPASFYTVVMVCCSTLTVCDLLVDLERATRWSRAADEALRTAGCPYLFAECRLVHGRVLMLTGRWTAAETELTAAANCTRGTFPGMYNRGIATLADLRLRQGRFEEARRLIDEVEAPVETSLVAAALALREGAPAAAAALVERWLGPASDEAVPPVHAGGRGYSLELAAALCLLAEARAAAGDAVAAAETEGRLEELGRRRRSGLAAAHRAFARGRMLLSSGGDDAESARCLERALVLFSDLELPLEAARARLDLARALRWTQPALATQEARAALIALDRLGASADADAAAALLRSWDAPGRFVARADNVLTRREREVLSLIEAGLSNPEIAERLYISPRTAAHHVSNLLAKLGVRNRAEAAGLAARLRPE
jgi:DNA-binding CsgD family transcriptional regulator